MNLAFSISEHKIELLFMTELYLLAAVVLLSTVLTIFFRIKDKLDKEKTTMLNQIVLNLISFGIDDFERYTPKKLLSLRLITKVLENYEGKVRGPFWNHLKEIILHELFSDQIIIFLRSSNALRISTGIRAVSLAPHVRFAPFISPLLKSKKPIIRFAAVGCSVKIGSQKLIEEVIVAMSQERGVFQYSYRDSLVGSDERIHEIIRQKYMNTEDEKIRTSCLKVIGLKMGYIKFNDLQKDLQSKSEELRWWATRALVNTPSDQSVETLIAKLKDPSWQVQSLALHQLGKIRNNKALPYLANNLHHSNFWIRLNSAVALHRLGSPGIQILNDQNESVNQGAYRAAQFVLDTPNLPFEKLIPEFREKAYF